MDDTVITAVSKTFAFHFVRTRRYSLFLSFTRYLYISLGKVMSSLGMIMVTIPFMVPFITSLGFDTIWLGVLMVVYSEIGVITPPVALNVYVLSGVIPPEITVGQIFRGVKWFIVMELLFVVILFVFPQLATWLPSVM